MGWALRCAAVVALCAGVTAPAQTTPSVPAANVQQPPPISPLSQHVETPEAPAPQIAATTNSTVQPEREEVRGLVLDLDVHVELDMTVLRLLRRRLVGNVATREEKQEVPS